MSVMFPESHEIQWEKVQEEKGSWFLWGIQQQFLSQEDSRQEKMVVEEKSSRNWIAGCMLHTIQIPTLLKEHNVEINEGKSLD